MTSIDIDILADDELSKSNIIINNNTIKKVLSPKVCSGDKFYGVKNTNINKQTDVEITNQSNKTKNLVSTQSNEFVKLEQIDIGNIIPNTNTTIIKPNISGPIDLSFDLSFGKSDIKPNIIKIDLDQRHKIFVINQANNIYKFPLLPIVEEVTELVDSPTKTKIKFLRRGFWDLTFGKLYRIKFLCQICGNVPGNFSGYRINKIFKWAKNILITLNISLHVLQFALNIIGIRNEIAEIGKLALNSLKSIQNDLVNSKLTNITPDSISNLKSNFEKNITTRTNINNNSNPNEIKYIPITIDYVNGIRDLFESLNDSNYPRNSGLICVTRPEDFECVWLCAGSTNCSSPCYKKFLSKESDPIIRYNFE